MLRVTAYDVTLDLTRGAERFWSRTQVRFHCRQAGAATFADLDAASIHRAALNGADLDLAQDRRGRLELPPLAEENVLVVDAEFAYASAAEGLHYVTGPGDGSACVYSKVTPHGAPGIYCCFDEQDLRALFTVTMRAPGGWSCLANGPVASQPPEGGPGIWRFAPTFPLPPWLSSFCAGPYAGPAFLCEHARDHLLPVTVQGGPAVAAVVEAEQIVDLLRQVLPYYERKLGVPYPYEKLDLLFVSGLSSLAYSVPGLIVLQDQLLNDPEHASADLYLATVIAHELAHAWAGGLVVMRSREDRWLDEALATYLSRTALAEILPGATPWAASTSAALPDYGYASNAAAIKQLEGLIGRQAVIAGLGALLRRHAHGSASKDDLARAWSRASRQDLRQWAATALIPADSENEPAEPEGSP
jgi:aminopeptidase N